MISVDILMIGAGPANIALGIAIDDSRERGKIGRVLIVEQNAIIRWHKDMLFPESQSQVSFLKDLVTLRNPTSRFSFLNFLHATGRLEDFVNLQTFFPYREEISDYLQWAANELQSVEVIYSTTVVDVQSVNTADGVAGWQVTTAGGLVYHANRLVFGGGRDANIPPPFNTVKSDRIFHSSRFLSSSSKFPSESVQSIAIIGGAQSSAEIYQACIQSYPLAEIKLLMRSIGMLNYGGSKFVNRFYENSQIDGFYSAAPSARATILERMRDTNYAGVAPATLEALFRHHYRQRMSGKQRTEIVTQSEVVAAADSREAVKLIWKVAGQSTAHESSFDFVVLGTGYLNAMPKLLHGIPRKSSGAPLTVGRNYRAEIDCAAGISLHLQGVNESTHGIADSLLSVLAHRSQEILEDILCEPSSRVPPQISDRPRDIQDLVATLVVATSEEVA